MIRLVIADDHPIVRQGLQRIIGDCADMRMVGEAVDGNALLGVLESAEVDVLVLDISMPGPPFLDLMRQLRAQWPGLKILIVSAHPEDQYAVRALKSGAAGYLSKDRSTEELAEAIRRVYRGGRYITPTLAEQLAAQVGPNSELPSHERLSEQEYRVLCLYGAGKSNKEIAAALGVSPKTVSTYRARILEKLRLNTTADLIRYTVKHDLSA